MGAEVTNTEQRGCEEAGVWSWLLWQVCIEEYVHALLDKETSVRRIATICCKIPIRVKLSKTDLNILGDRCGVQMYGVGE